MGSGDSPRRRESPKRLSEPAAARVKCVYLSDLDRGNDDDRFDRIDGADGADDRVKRTDRFVDRIQDDGSVVAVVALVVVARALVVRLADGAVLTLDTVDIAGAHRLVAALEFNRQLRLRLGGSRQGAESPDVHGDKGRGKGTEKEFLFHDNQVYVKCGISLHLTLSPSGGVREPVGKKQQNRPPRAPV